MNTVPGSARSSSFRLPDRERGTPAEDLGHQACGGRGSRCCTTTTAAEKKATGQRPPAPSVERLEGRPAEAARRERSRRPPGMLRRDASRAGRISQHSPADPRSLPSGMGAHGEERPAAACRRRAARAPFPRGPCRLSRPSLPTKFAQEADAVRLGEEAAQRTVLRARGLDPPAARSPRGWPRGMLPADVGHHVGVGGRSRRTRRSAGSLAVEELGLAPAALPHITSSSFQRHLRRRGGHRRRARAACRRPIISSRTARDGGEQPL